jgi:GT2 family glycosyltransferase
MELSIIVLNYNTKDLTINCLKSIVEQYKEELEKDRFEIIVVDNASTDDSLAALQKLKIKNLRVIESKENLGFSNGCNLGVKQANGEYLLFLNSDTEIKDQGFLRMMEYLTKNEKVGILGGALKNEDGTAQASVGKFYGLFSLFFMLLGFQRLGFLKFSPVEIKKADWVSGACLMIRKKVFDRIGGFEKGLFMYFEDMELCYKAGRKGFSTYFYPEISLYHKEQGSSSRTFAILNIYKGVLFFYKKYKAGWEYQLAKLMLKTKALILANLGKLMKNEYLKETYSEALKI